MKLLGSFCALLASAGAQAQTYLCEDCRDIIDYPIDAAAFALNAVYGPEQFIPFQAAESFYVMDYSGNVVSIYVNADIDAVWLLTINLARIGLAIPIPLSPDMEIQVIVKDAQFRELEKIRLTIPDDEDALPLPVGNPDEADDSAANDSQASAPAPSTGDSGGGSSGGGFGFVADAGSINDYLWLIASYTADAGLTCTTSLTINEQGMEEVRLVCNY